MDGRSLARRLLIATVLVACVPARPVLAQAGHELQVADRGPRFWAAPAPNDAGGSWRDARDAAVLRRSISVDFRQTPLWTALAEIARQAGMRLVASPTKVSLDTQVAFSASQVTVGAALTAVLFDAGVDVQLSADGQTITIVPRHGAPPPRAAPAQPSGGTIEGNITDSITKATIPGVTVEVLETRQRVVSNGQGRYTITLVSPGEYHVSARRVGFIARVRVVDVREGATTTLNFPLNQPSTKLNEIVTTALGDQRRYSVGNVISTINADSIVPTAPITSVTDLLTGRAPGLQIIETGGLVGSGEAIRIRGQSSLVLQSDPIIIVDGIREDNTPGGAGSPLFNAVGSPNRLNDLDFSQIATIDVLKGPAAATEYGTDAANGVIVITTKRGVSGRPQWNISAEEGQSDMPVKFPEYYYSWGHLTDGSNAATQCPLVPAYGSPSSTDGTCAVDSVTHFNPLNRSQYSIYGTGNRQKYNLSVSGGQDAIRYYVAGGLSNETGMARMPDVFRSEAVNIGLPAATMGPSGEQQRSARANTVAKLGSTADLTVTAAFMSTFQTIPASNQFASGPINGVSLPDSAHGYGYGQTQLYTVQVTPLEEFGQIQTQQTDRFTGGMTASWRPASWLTTNGTVGLDHGTQVQQDIVYPQSQYPLYHQSNRGAVAVTNSTIDIYSADFRASATAPLTNTIRAVSSIGVQMRDTRTAGQSGTAQELTATNLTLNGSASPFLSQQGSRDATLGGYGEEQFSFADRLFLTGALRIDAGSGFGYSYHTAAYPKVSVSWLAIQNTATSVRWRAAFGEAGVQPTNGASLQLYTPEVVYLNGGNVTALQINAPGNPRLEPERSEESEAGVDIGLFDNRINIDLTGYSKTTHNALYNQSLGFDLADATYEENIGEVRNNGIEATVTATVIQMRSFSWGFTLNAAFNSNKLLQLAPGITAQEIGITGSSQRNAVGYPLYGYWGLREHYADLNHDGIIEPNEVTLNDSASYLGSSIPKQTGSLATHITLWRMLTIGALFNYAGDYVVQNTTALDAARQSTLQEQNIAGAPQWRQARAVAATLPVAQYGLYPSGFFEDGTYVRFSELSATYELPVRWARRLRARSLSLTGAVRNLALWTRYSGPDPATSTVGAQGSTIQLGTNPSAPGSVNNDLRVDASSVPLARYWVLRLNIGL
ncbi:MAG TPA: SusC/RagA family TonB-linked outer membrane protein [Gemmatimonadaceae bacterium]|jgi:TonB-linked SusC/RagA family outer membrane protein|nr:SusC/RagA family TonB-linked outer membrane protein [Gemmatimonadaceae bacterium]